MKDSLDPAYQDSQIRQWPSGFVVGNDKRNAAASVYRSTGPFIKLDVHEESRTANEQGTVYLWKNEARELGKWLMKATRPTLKERWSALLATVVS
jgi:hypothetical protein